MLRLPEIENRVRQLASELGAPEHILPTFGYSEDGARPHLEVDDVGLLHYVVVDRGQESERHTALDLDDLLSHVFKHVTFTMASDFELKHRVALQDCRRLIFAKQIELMRILSSEWADRELRDHRAILARHPFDDAAAERASLAATLRRTGQSEASAWQSACQRFPLPKPMVDRDEDA